MSAAGARAPPNQTSAKPARIPYEKGKDLMAQTKRAAWGYRLTCHRSTGVPCFDTGFPHATASFTPPDRTARPHRDRQPVTPPRNGPSAAVAAPGDTHV